MHTGGRLIKEFDAFLHLFRAAAESMHHRVRMPSEDQFTLNRVLAGLGGPPAAAEVEMHLNGGESLPLLCLFLILGKDHCPVGLMDREVAPRLKPLVHIVAHALVPMAAGDGPLTAAEISRTPKETKVALYPLITYNEDGNVAAVLRKGGRNALRLGGGTGPFKVTINPSGPVVLDRKGPLHPVVVRATWRDSTFPLIRL